MISTISTEKDTPHTLNKQLGNQETRDEEQQIGHTLLRDPVSDVVQPLESRNELTIPKWRLICLYIRYSLLLPHPLTPY
jgi:hypothetical protein